MGGGRARIGGERHQPLSGLTGARLEAIFDALPAIVCALSGPDHVFEYVNDRYMEVVGRERPVLGLPVAEALPEIVEQGFIELLDHVYESGEPFYGTEVPVQLDRRDDGQLDLAYVNFVYLPTRDADGEIDGIMAHGAEVTDTVLARLRVEELALARDLDVQRASLATIIERMPAGVVLCDPAGRITEANGVWREFFGVALGEMRDVSSWRAFRGTRPDGTAYKPEEYPLARSIADGETVLGEPIGFARADGEQRVIEVSSAPIRDDAGEIVSGVAMFTDVTERLALQDELAERRAMEQAQTRLQTVFEAAGDGVWVLDERGTTVFINPAACALTGWEAEDLIGRQSHPVIHHSHADGSEYPIDECPIYRSVAEGEPCRVDDEVFWRKDGTSFAVQYTSTPIHDERGELRGAVQVFRDITEQRQAEERKSEFFANASHELRTPLTAIAGFAATLSARWSDLPDDQKLGFVDIIADQSARMSRLINDVLTLSRLERGKLTVEPQPVLVREVLDKVVYALAGQQIDVRCGEDVQVCSDPDHLEQMLLNYLHNALKYGGAPYVLDVVEEPDDVVIEVRDHGPGVPGHFEERLFERFSQAERRPEGSGTGLGLSIVQNLAQAQGGAAWFEPNEPTGARFFIRLPQPAQA